MADYPSTYKVLLFYAVDSAALTISEIFTLPNDDGHLYEDPDKPDSESKTADRIRASYKVDGNTITLQLEPLPVSYKLTYRYTFVNALLELAVKHIDSE